jgi:hypothetical protein
MFIESEVEDWKDIYKVVYKDKFGNEITNEELEPLLRDHQYRVVEQTVVGGYFISTVWLGVPYNMGSAYFETMVFQMNQEKSHWVKELELYRYADLKEAKQGHRDVLDKWIGFLGGEDMSVTSMEKSPPIDRKILNVSESLS